VTINTLNNNEFL